MLRTDRWSFYRIPLHDFQAVLKSISHDIHPDTFLWIYLIECAYSLWPNNAKMEAVRDRHGCWAWRPIPIPGCLSTGLPLLALPTVRADGRQLCRLHSQVPTDDSARNRRSNPHTRRSDTDLRSSPRATGGSAESCLGYPGMMFSRIKFIVTFLADRCLSRLSFSCHGEFRR